MFTHEVLIQWAAVLLTVGVKCVFVYLVAWLLAATVARHRPAWRSFLWIAVLASFPCLTLLEWAAGANVAAIALADDVPAPWLNGVAHAYLGVSLALAALVVHSLVRLHLLRSYSSPLDVSLEPTEQLGDDAHAPLPWLLLGTRLHTNHQLASPTSFGVLRPAILLPEPPVGSVYRDFVRAAVIHELIKTLRFDALWTLLARLIQCAWFAHPLVWRAFRHYCAAREQICDRWTVRTTGEVSEYESHLLAVARVGRPPAPMSVDMPMDWTGPRGVRRRIRDLQDYERPESLQPWPTVAATVGWMLLLAVLAAVTLEQTDHGHAPGLRTRAMLMGVTGALMAGGLLTGLLLFGRGHHARLTPPIDGLAGRSRQTVAECVHRLEREWRDLQTTLSGTFRRLEPLLLMLVVVAATMGFWLLAGPGDSGDSSGEPAMEMRVDAWR